jgi:rhodanese-related sulfurtransferase
MLAIEVPSKTTRLADRVAMARALAEELDPREVAAELEAGRAVLVDVREPAETAVGTVPGAALVPRGVLELSADVGGPRHDPRLRPDRRVILCSARGVRSALAVLALYDVGYADVAHLRGGLAAWCAAGLPLTAPGGGPVVRRTSSLAFRRR